MSIISFPFLIFIIILLIINEWFKEHLMMPAVTSGWNRKASKSLGKILGQKYHEYFLKLMAVYDAPYILAHDVDFDNHNPDYFEDMSHMSGEGRRMYTKELIKHLPVSD